MEKKETVAKHVVALAWATKKRHIAIDGKVLCEAESKCDGYSVKNGKYNGLALRGIPSDVKDHDDTKYTHTDGIIDFAPLDKQPTVIIERSVCSKCLKKYNKLFNTKKDGY